MWQRLELGPAWARSEQCMELGPAWARSKQCMELGPAWARSHAFSRDIEITILKYSLQKDLVIAKHS